MLSVVNWFIEAVRWHWALKYKSIEQSFSLSYTQVLYAVPYALVFGKIAGSTTGRLIHFKSSSLKNAIKAQILTSVYQSAALLCFLVGSIILIFHLYSLFFAIVLFAILMLVYLNKELIQLIFLSVMRTALIFGSYLFVLHQFSSLDLIVALSKTFSIMTFIPFTPIANLGPKEWLMHYFYDDIGLEQYLKAGLIIFVFNNLLPAVFGVIISLVNKWK